MFGQHVKQQLTAYAHGELSAPETNRIAAHLGKCARCRREFEEINFAISLAERLPAQVAPDALWDNIEAALAGDITQQVFLKLFTRISQFRHQSEFTTWLYRLTTNTCIDEQRKRRRFSPLPDTLAATDVHNNSGARVPAAEARFMRLEVADSVRDAIATLKPKLRIAILLKYFEELSYEEIAQVLNCSKGTVASRLNRGHRILARRLGHLRANVLSGD